MVFRFLALSALVVPIAAAAVPERDPLAERYPDAVFVRSASADWRVCGRPFGGGSSPVDSASRFLSDVAGSLLGVDVSSLVLEGTADLPGGRLIALYFRQAAFGLPVDGGSVTAVARNSPPFALVLVAGSARPVDLCGPAAPTLSARGAAALALAAADGGLITEEAEPVVYAGGEVPRLAFRVTLRSADPSRPFRRSYWIDASTGAALGEEERLRWSDVAGTVSAWVTPGLLPDCPSNPPFLVPLSGARVTSQSGATTFTDELGAFVLPVSGFGPQSLTASVAGGRWADVWDALGPPATADTNVLPPGPAVLMLNPPPDWSTTAQVNAFVSASVAHDFGAGAIPNCDVSLPVRVNLDIGSSAYFDGSSINFGRGAPGAANTAYSTVIYHEYGHFLVDRGHPTAGAAFHEGAADAVSNLITRDPAVGLDFLGPGTGPVRDSMAACEAYPSTAEPHVAGQMLAGSLWKTCRNLAAELGEEEAARVTRGLLFGLVLLRPPAISPQIVLDVLTADDDDGDLLNGTPHMLPILAGFASHNLLAPPLPAVRFDVEDPGLSAPPCMPTRVRATVAPALAEPDASTARLWFSTDGASWLERAATCEQPLCFDLPPLPPGTPVRWFVSVDTAEGYRSYWPPGGPWEPRLLVIAEDAETVFADDCEIDVGWTAVNTASSGGWERGAPAATIFGPTGEIAQPGGDNPYDTGLNAWATGLAGGASASDGDLDGGPVTLTSPPINLAGADGVVSFSSWLFNDDGDDPLIVSVSGDGGATWREVRRFTDADYVSPAGRSWKPFRFVVGDFVTPGPDVRVRFSIADQPNNSITEAALDTFRVIRFVRAEPNVLRGRVEPVDFDGDLSSVTLRIEARDPATGAVLLGATVSPDAAGRFGVNAPCGVFDLAVKGDRWLRTVLPGVSAGSGETFVPLGPNGDADGDNRIGVADLNAVLLALGRAGPLREDLNGSGVVDAVDLNLALLNFGLAGSP